jgi:tyrosine decarboxylase/aspartate 1-decarboxylase
VTGLEQPAGYIASGGTEANIQGVRAARELAGERDTPASTDPTIVAGEHVHFSVRKAADLLNVELLTAPLTDEYRVDTTAIAELVDERTALVVGVAGSTEYGRVDPIAELASIADRVDAPMHVDAAWGGFVLPFADAEWNFADAPIDSMTIDPHKMGQAAVPAGGFLARDQEILDALAVDTPYLESTSQATLTGTRSGAGVASALAAMEELWPSGYQATYERQQANAEWLAAELADRGFDVVDPVLPLVAADIPTSLFECLRDDGWRISRTSAGELRIVLMPHVTREMLEQFLADLDSHRAVSAGLCSSQAAEDSVSR